MRLFSVLVIVFAIAVIFEGCDKKGPVDPAESNYANADNSKGGIMYDKFWSPESGFDQDHSAMAVLTASSDFFRCKQCHGWEGLGREGAYIGRAPKTTRPNVADMNLYQLAQSKSPKELFNALKETANRRDISYDLSAYNPESNSTEGDKMPDLNQLLTDAQIWDIVKFLNEGLFDVSEIYDASYSGTYPSGSFTFSNWGIDGDASSGNNYYTANCAVCHGDDGTAIDLEGKTVGKFTRTKSYEVQHKVKYGQLGSSMTGEFDITLTEMKDLYKALGDNQAFPDEAPVVGDVSIGGIMFDKFWSTESGFDQDHSAMPTLNSFSDFFRCKQCHGWDGLGRNGAYISRAPKTTRPNVAALDLYAMAQAESDQALFDGLKETANRRDISYDLSGYDPESNSTEGDKMPNLNQLLTDKQMWDIVEFLKEGIFDVNELYDATYTGTYPTGTATFSNIGRDGNSAEGITYYTAQCAACHGDDGTLIDLEGKTVGKFVRTKSNETQHKVKYGQLGSIMAGEFDISLSQMRDLYKACADTLAFPD